MWLAQPRNDEPVRRQFPSIVRLVVAGPLSILNRMPSQIYFTHKKIMKIIIRLQRIVIVKHINFESTYVVESRTKKQPGGAFRKSAIASSREIVGLYQNFDESRTYLLEYDVRKLSLIQKLIYLKSHSRLRHLLYQMRCNFLWFTVCC